MKTYTINSDASFSWKHQRAAWAYWVKSDDFHAKASGMFDKNLGIRSNYVAELLAFEKGLARVNKLIPAKHRSAVRLYVNTDCTYVIDVLNQRIKKSYKNMTLIRAVQHAAKDYQLVVRHVKAHTGDLSTARSYINDWCDKAARMEMGKEIYDT